MKTGKALSNIGENAEQTAWRIANEFQTPLGVIISAGELLESYFERLTPDRRRLALEDILFAARQMNSAMDQLTVLETKKNSNSASARLRSNQKQTQPTHSSRLRPVRASRKATRSSV
jgi:signal transduction histidine kinase